MKKPTQNRKVRFKEILASVLKEDRAFLTELGRAGIPEGRKMTKAEEADICNHSVCLHFQSSHRQPPRQQCLGVKQLQEMMWRAGKCSYCKKKIGNSSFCAVPYGDDYKVKHTHC